MPGVEDVLTSLAGGSISYVSTCNLYQRCLDLLEDEPWETTTSTAATSASSPVVFLVPDATRWAEGDVLEWSDCTGEQARVITKDDVANTLTVKRAHNGTTGQAHAADAVILKNPKFTYQIVTRALTGTIQSELFPDVYLAASDTITPLATATIYDLPSDFEDIISVCQQATSTYTTITWYGTGSGWNYRILRPVPTTIAGSGIAIEFPQGFDNLTNTVQVNYRERIGTDTVPDGDIAELVVLGAVGRLMTAKEIPATSDDPLATTSPNQTPGAQLRIGAYHRQRFETLRRDIKSRLWRELPPARRYFG